MKALIVAIILLSSGIASARTWCRVPNYGSPQCWYYDYESCTEGGTYYCVPKRK